MDISQRLLSFTTLLTLCAAVPLHGMEISSSENNNAVTKKSVEQIKIPGNALTLFAIFIANIACQSLGVP